VFYVAPDGNVQDDGLGGEHQPYAIDRNGQRVALPQKMAAILATRYASAPPAPAAPAYPQAPQQQPMPAQPFSPEHVRAMRSMFPVGDLIAKLTSSVGIQPCEPCKRRQEMLNSIGDRFARRFW
jgi:hypothetical protein